MSLPIRQFSWWGKKLLGSNKINCIAIRENFKTQWRFLKHKLFAFIQRWKKTWLAWKKCKNLDFCEAVLLIGENDILKNNYHAKLIKLPCAIYVNFETILKKVSICESRSEISHMTEIYKYTACGFSIFVKFAYGKSKTKPFLYRESDWSEQSFESVGNVSPGSINIKKKLIFVIYIIKNSM